MTPKFVDSLMTWSKRILAKAQTIHVLITAAACFFVGVIFWGGFNYTLDVTNTEKFCIGCHEMKEFVYKPYTETNHYSNRTGVRATCPDCHVPKVYAYKLMKKVKATNELYHKMMGTISTQEKFDAKKLHMAENVWREMKNSDSRECRNCHKYTYMNYEKQEKRSARKHKKGFERGETCIDCHKGIAHKLPVDYEEE